MNNGGPAFPTSVFPSAGLSIRDYFAAAALPAVLAGLTEEDRRKHNTGIIALSAKAAYAIADAMMDAEKAEPDSNKL